MKDIVLKVKLTVMEQKLKELEAKIDSVSTETEEVELINQVIDDRIKELKAKWKRRIEIILAIIFSLFVGWCTGNYLYLLYLGCGCIRWG